VLSIEQIRREPEAVRLALARRGEDAPLEPVLELDARRRTLVTERDTLRAQHNDLSKRFGQIRREEQPHERNSSARLNRLRQEIQGVTSRIETLERESTEVESKLHGLLLELPNLALPQVPEGLDESGNIVLRQSGEPAPLDFEPLPHWELGERLDIIDFERGVKLSGSRFFVLKGAGAQLERALINWMLDLHIREHGYTEILPPALVREATMLASGNLPKFGDNLYRDAEEDLWAIPTAEVPLTSLHRDEILDPGVLPISYVACTPSFRREKAAAGRDTRGIKRVHQFNKVEMYRFVEPTTSQEALEQIVAAAEAVCRGLGFTWRVLQLCAGDLGFPSAMTYDVEVWAPGCKEWLEVSSCSNCTDFQARRASIRYRPEAGARPELVHTLNGSGLALPRTLIAVLESYQQADGSVLVPEVLQPYTGFSEIRAAGG
jgi:seryl-tRNA synthetase